MKSNINEEPAETPADPEGECDDCQSNTNGLCTAVDPPAPVGIHRCPEYEPRPGEFDLKDQPYVDVTIRFYRAFNPTESRGVTCFKVGYADVSDPVTKKVLGTIAAEATGTMVLTDNVSLGNAEFMCTHQEVWAAFQKALAQKRCPVCRTLFGHKLQCPNREDGGQVKLSMKRVPKED